jgi:hypothetical protein
MTISARSCDSDSEALPDGAKRNPGDEYFNISRRHSGMRRQAQARNPYPQIVNMTHAMACA